MFIDLSNQNEGDGRGFAPVEARPQHACRWGAYFARQKRLQGLRRVINRVLKRKNS